MEENSIRDKAGRIKMLVLDVDGTLTDGGVYIDANGVQSRKFSIRDGMGITQLLENNIEVGLISFTRSGTIVEERARMLGIRLVFAGKESKLTVLHRWLHQLSLNAKEVAYIGDDINDIEVMKAVGLSACPADAHFKVIRQADIVLSRNGGDGCVREFIDRYLLPEE